MKRNIYIISGLIIFISNCSKLPAQTKMNSDKDGVIYTCDTLKTSNKFNQLELIGNVCYKTKKFSVNCQKIDWNVNTKNIIAYNFTSFDFNGHVVLVSEQKILGVLQYSIGDNSIFIK